MISQQRFLALFATTALALSNTAAVEAQARRGLRGVVVNDGEGELRELRARGSFVFHDGQNHEGELRELRKTVVASKGQQEGRELRKTVTAMGHEGGRRNEVISSPIVVGKCPEATQSTGMQCSLFVPAGNVGTMCMYGASLCECDLSKGSTWTCQERLDLPHLLDDPKDGRDAPIVDPTPPATPPVVVRPNPVNQIDFPVIHNPPNCPATKPESGDSCRNGGKNKWLRCHYYVETGGVKIGAVNCDCDKAGSFHCRKDNRPLFVNLFPDQN